MGGGVAYYHIEVVSSDGERSYWWDLSKEDVIHNIIIPFVNSQIVPQNDQHGEDCVFNFGSVISLYVFKTERQLDPRDTCEIPRQLSNAKFRSKHNCTEQLLGELRFEHRNRKTLSLLQRTLLIPERRVFVIMKFGDEHLDSAYEGAIKRVCHDMDYKTLRIDEIQDSGQISEQILDAIARSEVIVADLTGERPNCYYEAGYAHALGKDIIYTIRKGEVPHFDVRGYRFIEWTTEEDLRRKLKVRLETLREPLVAMSP